MRKKKMNKWEKQKLYWNGIFISRQDIFNKAKASIYHYVHSSLFSSKPGYQK